MLIDYTVHDAAYKYKREHGFAGWDSDEVIEENIRQLNSLFEHSAIPKQGKILDIGCGAGNVSFWLESKGYNVTGIDVSAEAIEWAKEKAVSLQSRVRFSAADATQEHFIMDSSFDIILDNHCLHCIIGKDRKQYLNNIYKSLSKGGVYILLTMCSNGKPISSVPNYDSDTRCVFYNNTATRYIGLYIDIMTELIEAGFTIKHQELSEGIDSPAELIVVAVRCE